MDRSLPLTRSISLHKVTLSISLQHQMKALQILHLIQSPRRRPHWKLSLTRKRSAECSSPKRKPMSLSGVSATSDTCRLPSVNSWRTCSASLRRRWRSGSRITATRWREPVPRARWTSGNQRCCRGSWCLSWCEVANHIKHALSMLRGTDVWSLRPHLPFTTACRDASLYSILHHSAYFPDSSTLRTLYPLHTISFGEIHHGHQQQTNLTLNNTNTLQKWIVFYCEDVCLIRLSCV